MGYTGSVVRERVVIQKITTCLAALPPIHAALEREAVPLMQHVLEVWFVDTQTALMGILT